MPEFTQNEPGRIQSFVQKIKRLDPLSSFSPQERQSLSEVKKNVESGKIGGPNDSPSERSRVFAPDLGLGFTPEEAKKLQFFKDNYRSMPKFLDKADTKAKSGN